MIALAWGICGPLGACSNWQCRLLNHCIRAPLKIASDHNWASSWDYGTYYLGYQWWLRWACTPAQSLQSLRCSHTWSMEVDEGSDQKSDIYPHSMAAHTQSENEFLEDEKYHNLIMRWLNFVFQSANLLGVKMLCVNLEGASLKGCNFEDPAGSRANMEGKEASWVRWASSREEPRHEKTYLRDFPTGKTQTGLLSYRS